MDRKKLLKWLNGQIKNITNEINSPMVDKTEREYLNSQLKYFNAIKDFLLNSKVFILWEITMDEMGVNEIYNIHGVYESQESVYKARIKAEKDAEEEGQNYKYDTAGYNIIDK